MIIGWYLFYEHLIYIVYLKFMIWLHNTIIITYENGANINKCSMIGDIIS